MDDTKKHRFAGAGAGAGAGVVGHGDGDVDGGDHDAREDAPLLQQSSSPSDSSSVLHANANAHEPAPVHSDRHDHDPYSFPSPTESYRSNSDSDADSYFQSNRQRRHAALITQRNISFLSAVAGASCAGSITVFSLYGHLFQERLHYSQYQVNGVAVVASFALYLSNTIFGYICDRRGPAPLCALSAALCATGYGLAAVLYKRGVDYTPGPPTTMSYGLMMLAFILIGTGSCALYSASVSSCAKNFGKGKYRGLALAVPITAVGLSGVWQSQVASRLLYETLPDGSRGDVNVFYFFIFLAVLFCLVGIVGTFLMKVIDEDELIDEAVEELERSGLLDSSALFSPTRARSGYGSLQRRDPDPIEDEEDPRRSFLAQDLDDDAISKKNWVLNAETRRFFGDHTMWFFAAGFFLVIGPAEAFINNMGTVIKTLYSPTEIHLGSATSAATHVSIICAASTAVRLLVGALTDLLAPAPATQHLQIPAPDSQSMLQRIRFSVSRVSFWICFAVILSLGMSILASGVIQDHGERFWIISASVGAGYGALFSITPIIVTIIWGVENFGTNWGIM